MPEETDPLILIRQKEVLRRTALSRTGLFELLRAGKFPAPSKLPNSRVNVWSATDVTAWIRNVIEKD